MKAIKILILLLMSCSIAFAQDVKVSGPKKQPTKTTSTLRNNSQVKNKTQQQTRTSLSKPKPQEIRTETFNVNGVSFNMCYVEGGTFMMGVSKNQKTIKPECQKPEHMVELSNYYIGQTEVTQALWKAVMGSNPSRQKGDNLPVECVSWNDCQEFVDKINSLTGRNFRLPTEAEWEYVARGGIKSRGYSYSGSNKVSDVAWYSGNSNDKTHPVASKKANELGVYDMCGNVEEWCIDWFNKEYYKNSPTKNPVCSDLGNYRVCRGGDYLTYSYECTVDTRSYKSPTENGFLCGLRLAMNEN